MSQIQTTLGDVFGSTPMGDVSRAVGDAFYGFNQQMTPGLVPQNRDIHGLVFFTRPQLNLTRDNLLMIREMVGLLSNNDQSIQRIVRKLLDPRIQDPCRLVDPEQAFIPLLTNQLLSLSGWPDIQLDVHTSKPGMMREELTYVDSAVQKYEAFNLSCTFRNMVNDPISYLIYIWQLYMTLVFRGEMMPYPDFIANNEYDYHTRIYKLEMDAGKKIVQKIACTGAAFPTSLPVGQMFNHEHDRPRNNTTDEINVTFRCMGFRYFDPITVTDFNNVVGIFNPAMRLKGFSREFDPTSMVKIDFETLPLFKNRGYPRIDPDTMELQWWVSKGQYDSTIAAYNRINTAINPNFRPIE